MTIIRERLIELRNRKGLSQRELAEIIGVPGGTVGMWESGKRNPKEDAIENIAKALSCDVDYLKGVTNHPITLKPIEDIFANLTDKEKELFELIRALPVEQFEKAVEELILFVDNFEKENPQQ